MPHLSDVHLVLAAMAYLLVKHALADFLLQTAYQRATKGIYGGLGGFTHSLTHIALTAPVLLMFPAMTATLGAAIIAAEAVVHYHIDWLKEQIVRGNGWTSHDTLFWWALGIDQLMHGLTYVAMVWAAMPQG